MARQTQLADEPPNEPLNIDDNIDHISIALALGAGRQMGELDGRGFGRQSEQYSQNQSKLTRIVWPVHAKKVRHGLDKSAVSIPRTTHPSISELVVISSVVMLLLLIVG